MVNSSLEKLVDILPENQFEIMKSMFPTVSGENIQLLKQKSYKPYLADLNVNCALLACFCEFHREFSFTAYKLDCMHYFTLPEMAREASLRIFKANVELLTEREHLDMSLQSAVASPLSTKIGASLLITNTFQTTIAQKIINSVSVLMRTICTKE